MSDDLVAFLLARIAEDEQVARAAGTGRWQHRGHDDESNPWIVTADDDVLVYDEVVIDQRKRRPLNPSLHTR